MRVGDRAEAGCRQVVQGRRQDHGSLRRYPVCQDVEEVQDVPVQRQRPDLLRLDWVCKLSLILVWSMGEVKRKMLCEMRMCILILTLMGVTEVLS